MKQNRNRLTGIKNKLVVTRADRHRGRDKIGVVEYKVQTTEYKIDK